jgi:hypothetical protein
VYTLYSKVPVNEIVSEAKFQDRKTSLALGDKVELVSKPLFPGIGAISVTVKLYSLEKGEPENAVSMATMTMMEISIF